MTTEMLTGVATVPGLELNIGDDYADDSDKKDCDDGKNDRSAVNGSHAQERV